MPINVKDFGAIGDGVSDDWLYFQRAIDALTDAGGEIKIPSDTYLLSEPLVMRKNIILSGEGKGSTKLIFNHLRDGISMASPINTSTAVNVKIRDLTLWCTNPMNEGAGYKDVCGTFWSLDSVMIRGFKYGVIMDQSELCDIVDCTLTAQGYAGAWLVNGPDRELEDVLPGFTNRVSFQRCQIDQTPHAYGILDDGGYTHSFKDCNFNGCSTHLRSAGVHGNLIESCHFESAKFNSIVLSHLRDNGEAAGSGISTTVISSSLTAASPINELIKIVSQGKLNVIGTQFYGTGVSIVGASNCYQLYAAGNHGLSVIGTATIDNRF